MDIFLQSDVVAAANSTAQKVNAAGASSSMAFARQMSAATSVSAPKTLESIFKQASQRYGVPENLLKAVAKVESNFNADAVSRCGATGIMQLMPSTAKSLGVTDLKDPEQNIMGGAKELSQLLKRYNGDLKLTLAGYNAGIGNVAKYGGVPPFAETQAYVKKVLAAAGQDIAVPNQTVSSSGGTNVTPSVQTGLNTMYSEGLGFSMADVREALFTGTDTDYTYEDYQLFLELYLNDARQKAGQFGSSVSETSPAFWL